MDNSVLLNGNQILVVHDPSKTAPRSDVGSVNPYTHMVPTSEYRLKKKRKKDVSSLSLRI